MTAQQEKDIIEHGNNLLAIFTQCEKEPMALCRIVRKFEKQAHDLATDCCNGDVPDSEARKDEILRLLNAALGNDGSVPVFINGDPRGYSLKIEDEWVRANNPRIYRDWGGYGIIAPEIGKNGLQ
jgi:hypothetical protein